MPFLIALAGFLLSPLLTRLAILTVTGKSSVICPYCQTPYRPWFALEGLILHRGRCPSCGAPYLFPYALAEVSTPVIFSLIWQKFGLTFYTLFALLYSVAFILLFVTDTTHRLLPNVVVFPAIILALIGEGIREGLNPGPYLRTHIMGGFLSLLLFITFYALGQAFARWKSVEEVAFGLGDVKLAALIGIILGYPKGLQALLAGVFLNGIVALAIMVRGIMSKRFNPLTPFPYGPGLMVSFFTFWLFPP